MIEAAAIDITSPSPPITASQSQGVSSLSRPSTNTCFGVSGSACTARASAHSEARRMLSRSIRAGEAKATANDAVAQISSNSSSRRSARQPLGIVDAFRDPLRVEHDGRGHHRAGQRPAPGLVAARHRPDAALDQRALAPKARRRDRDRRLSAAWPALSLSDLSRIMPGCCADEAGGATGNSGHARYSAHDPSVQRASVRAKARTRSTACLDVERRPTRVQCRNKPHPA